MVASNPASKDLVNVGLNAAGTIPNFFGPTKFVIGVNGAGTAYALDAFKPGIGTTGLGKLALGGLGELFTGKAIYDGIVYTGSIFSCYQSPDHP